MSNKSWSQEGGLASYRSARNRGISQLARRAGRVGAAAFLALTFFLSALAIGQIGATPLLNAPQTAFAAVNTCPPGTIYQGGPIGEDVCVPGGTTAFASSVTNLSPGIFRYRYVGTGSTIGDCVNNSTLAPNNQNGTGSGALGEPNDYDGDSHAYATSNSASLGYGGSITVRMGLPITGSGDSAPDVFVWEQGISGEAYDVYVSEDGVSFTQVGTAVVGGTGVQGAQGFDIDDNGFTQLSRVNYVRVVGTAPAPAPNPTTGAFCNDENKNLSGPDIDAIAGLSSVDPSIEIEKTAAPATGLVADDVVTYSFLVTNTGTDTLNSVAVTDPLPGLSAISCPQTSLDPEETMTCTATYTVTQADVDAAVPIPNTATVDGVSEIFGEPVTDTDDAEITFDLTPAIAIDKVGVGPDPLLVGETVNYTFTVQNTGTVSLTDVTVTDPMPGLTAIDCPVDNDLAPGEQMVCTASYVIVQADVDAGIIENTATATGQPPAACTTCTPPTGTDTETVPPDANPALDLVKSASPVSGVVAGDVITYTFTATNIGNVTLTNVTIDDPMPGLSALSCQGSTTLLPGASLVCTATYTVTQADVDAGSVNNVATADGDTPPDCTTCPPVDPPTDSEEVPSNQTPGITIEKTADSHPDIAVGDVITYTFLVTNTGTVTLTDVTVTDPLPGLSAISPASVASLAPGASTTFTATYTVVQADVDSGSVTNTATVTGDPPVSCTTCTPPTDTDGEIVPNDANPSLSIDKEADTAGPVNVGDTITYTFTVTNTGNITLENVTVTDPLPGMSAITPASVATLSPGASTPFTATYVVTQADADAGVVTNTATANADTPASCQICPPVEPVTDIENVPVEQTPGIEIDKIADYTTALVVGETINYQFVVTNTGNVTLTNVTVTDPLSGLSAISPASVAVLAPGDSTTFTASYVITQADVDAGTLTNTATATGDVPPTCVDCVPPTDDDTEIVPGDPQPALGIEKTSDVLPGAPLAVGDTITYTFEVTNTGNVTIENVTVTDPLPGLSAITPASVALLNPGASTTFTATYVVTQADIDAGSILNTATADGDPPTTCQTCPPVDPPNDELEILVPQTPGLEITKSSDPIGGVLEDETITYTFDVVNTGNVTLTDVTITDALPGLTWVTGPNVGTLAPGESATGTATYVVVQADIDAGTVHNTATVTGTPPVDCDCTPPTDEDEHNVPTAGTPGLDLVKTSNVPVGETVGVGETVTYTFTLTNTGNVPITDATITDSLPGLTWVVGPNLGTILAGESATGTATYVVTQADVDAGVINNAATADGDCGPDCDVTPPTDEVEVPTDPAAPALNVEKSSDPTGGVTTGDVITYTFTVTNTGNVTLTDVTVTDPLPGLSAITPASVATLAPGGIATFTATYTVSASDVARGFVLNNATATAQPPASCTTCQPPTDEDEHTVPTTGNPGILINKDADTDGPVALGQTITYTFDVFNTGDVNL